MAIPSFKEFLIRRIASRRLSALLSVIGALFLTKELLHSFIDVMWEIGPRVIGAAGAARWHGGFVARLAVECLFFLFFFVIAFKVFRDTHADEYLRHLMLLVIKDPKSYLIFLQKFICDRIKALKGDSPHKRVFEEIDMLLATGKQRFGLHHKRSVCYLLGLNYPRFKTTMERLENKELSIDVARELLEEAVLAPLRCLGERALPYSRKSKREHLISLLTIAAEPSYDRALFLFCEELKGPIENLKKNAENELGAVSHSQIIRETCDVLKFFEMRCKARMGFPLYDFIDQKSGDQLRVIHSRLQHLNADEVDEVRYLLTKLSECLKEFLKDRKNSQETLKKELESMNSSTAWRIDADRETVCLYGFSRTVKLFLEKAFAERERAKVGFMLVKTDHLATTPFEERTMRDELLDMGFVDVAVHAFQDLLLFEKLPRPLVFCLGYEVINSKEGIAVFHFGAGQLLHRLIWSLATRKNEVRVVLVGAEYKDIGFKITSPQVVTASIFDYKNLPVTTTPIP